MINNIEPWKLEDRAQSEADWNSFLSCQPKEPSKQLESFHEKKMQQIHPIREAFERHCKNSQIPTAALMVGVTVALVAILAHFGVLNSLSRCISTKMSHALSHWWSHLNSVSQKLMFRIPLIMGIVAAVTGITLEYHTKSVVKAQIERDKQIYLVLNQDGPCYQGD